MINNRYFKAFKCSVKWSDFTSRCVSGTVFSRVAQVCVLLLKVQGDFHTWVGHLCVWAWPETHPCARERATPPSAAFREIKPIIHIRRFLLVNLLYTTADVIPRHIWEYSWAHMILKNSRNSEWVLEPDLFIFVYVQSSSEILTPQYYEYNEEMLEINRENK